RFILALFVACLVPVALVLGGRSLPRLVAPFRLLAGTIVHGAHLRIIALGAILGIARQWLLIALRLPARGFVLSLTSFACTTFLTTRVSRSLRRLSGSFLPLFFSSPGILASARLGLGVLIGVFLAGLSTATLLVLARRLILGSSGIRLVPLLVVWIALDRVG